MRSSSPRASLATMCGSAMCARVMPTMSTWPASMACRAVLRSAMRVAWKTGMPAAARISAARARKADGWPMVGISSEMPRSVVACARTMLR